MKNIMNGQGAQLIALYCFALILVFSCNQREEPVKHYRSNSSSSSSSTNKKRKLLELKNDSILVVVDSNVFTIPRYAEIKCDNPYNGIIVYNGNTKERKFSLIKGNKLYFTIYDDAGSGNRTYLFAYDMSKKTLVKDLKFKHNYLYSSSGLIFIKGDEIISIGKSKWHKGKITLLTVANIYKIRLYEFKHKKSIYIEGDSSYSDSSTIAFFDEYLIRGGKEAKIFR